MDDDGADRPEGMQRELDRLEPVRAPDTPEMLAVAATYRRVAERLGVPREDRQAALTRRLEGGVLPPVNLAALESLAAAGGARVRVLIEVDGGATHDLALL